MKSRITAAILAVFLGGLGVHKFYLRDTGTGIFYLMLTIFGATLRFPIATILAWIDAFTLFTMSDERFDKKYNSGSSHKSRGQRRSSRREDRYDRREDRYDRREDRRDNRNSRKSSRRRVPADADYRKAPTTRRRSSSQSEQRRKKANIIKDNPFKISGIKRLKDFELDLAEVDLNKALELAPNDIDVHFALGKLYSMIENKKKSYSHIAKAVQYGFRDVEKIKTSDELAYIRIQPDFDEFEESGFEYSPTGKTKPSSPKVEEEQAASNAPLKEGLLQDDLLLSQLNKLAELRKKGLLSEREFEDEKVKLMRR